MTKDVIAKLQNLTLLYAEDEEGIRKNIADSLSYYVKEVIEASNGAEAFELYEQKKPDIILSDINMPLLNGIDMVKQIRGIKDDVPVIFATAHSDSEFLIEAIKVRAENYVVKPLDIKKLLLFIQEIALKLHQDFLLRHL